MLIDSAKSIDAVSAALNKTLGAGENARAGGVFKTHSELAIRHDLGLGVPQREYLGMTHEHITAFNVLSEKMLPNLLKEAAEYGNG